MPSITPTLSIDGKDIGIKKELANCYHMKKDYTSALKYYDEVLEAEPDNYDIKVNKAIALHALDRYEDAIELYKEITSRKENPIVESNLTDAYVAQGKVDLDLKNYTKASEEFELAISRGTKDGLAYYGLAKCYRVSGANDKVGELYEKAIELSPGQTLYSDEYAAFIAEMNAAASTMSATTAPVQPAESQTVTTPVTTPADAPAENGKLPSISVENSEENVVTIANVDRSKDLIAKGDANYKKDDYDAAIDNYKEALKVNPNDEVTLLKLGNIYKLKDDNSKALDYYKKSIVVNPDYTDGWFNLGLVYANDNNISKSKECFEKVISFDPEYAYAYYALAIAFEGEENKDEAVKNYNLFLKYNKDANMVKVVEDRINNLQK